MPRIKKTVKKSTIEQEVAELKSIVSLLVKKLDGNVKQTVSKPQAKVNNKLKSKKTKDTDSEDGGAIRAGRSKKLRQHQSKTQSHPHSIYIGPRENIFDKMMERNAFKEDTKIDKKLWKGRKPSPRGERATIIEVECDECGNEFQISPNELRQKEDENGRMSNIYTCDDCLRDRS
jgi:hypothetical protein